MDVVKMKDNVEESTTGPEFQRLVVWDPLVDGHPHTLCVCSLNTAKSKGGFHSGLSCHKRKRADIIGWVAIPSIGKMKKCMRFLTLTMFVFIGLSFFCDL